VSFPNGRGETLAGRLDLPREGRDFAVAHIVQEEQQVVRIPPEVDLGDMLEALRDVMIRADLFSRHQVQMEPLSVRERMTAIIAAAVRMMSSAYWR
jgi:segregation and condensation protein A